MDLDKNKKIHGKWFADKKKLLFGLDFILVLIITFSTLYLFDLVPEEFKNVIGRYPDSKVKEVKGQGEIPLSIKIPSIGINSQIYNPTSTDVNILDSYLLKGAVHYPGSALLGTIGNVFLFGHSTGYKIVNNQAYKTFNGLKNLKAGDLISVFSDKNEYIYKVLNVKLEGADETLVKFGSTGKKLTLSTCNTFGAKSERYVVEAEQVNFKPIAK
ncbi:MAG: sortase [Candidatus Taylorbacteria bacterium]|nr:sortase [Candidatus Taylorbacteria bacterium]